MIPDASRRCRWPECEPTSQRQWWTRSRAQSSLCPIKALRESLLVRSVETEMSLLSTVTASFYFPNAVPSDARRSPFSGTARVSQTLQSSELIACPQLQTRERALPDRSPQSWARCFLSAFCRLRRRKNSLRNIPDGTAVA